MSIPPFICILFLKKKSFDSLSRIRFSKHNISLTSTQVIYLIVRSIFQGPTLSLLNRILQSFLCPIPQSRHNEQCLLDPNLKVFCVQHPAWILSAANLQRILFLYRTRVSEDFFITDHLLSSFLQLSKFWRMIVYCVYDTLLRKSSG